MDLGLMPVNTSDKLRFVIGPTTIVGRLENGSNWLVFRCNIEEITAEIVRDAEAYSDCI